jgi:hypothetical protein
MRLNDLIGQEVYFGLWLEDSKWTHAVIQVHGKLTHPVGPDTAGTLPSDDHREASGYLYGVGEQSITCHPCRGRFEKTQTGSASTSCSRRD